MPVLTIDNTTKIAQSIAIARFLAKNYGLAGKDNIESAILDSYADLFMDFWTEVTPYLYIANGMRQGNSVSIF